MKLIKDRGFTVFIIVSTAVVLFTLLVQLIFDNYYRLYFGPVHPLLAAGLASILGAAALSSLRKRGGIKIINYPTVLKGVASAAIGAGLFSIPVISADLLFRFPENLNVPLPAALLFYPSIGFVAEITFHVLPLTVVLFFFSLRRTREKQDPTVLLFLPAIITEPIFQTIFAEDIIAATTIFTFFHVALVAAFQLRLLKRYDFLTMFAFRIFYYFLWHILWGFLRLHLLF